MFDREILKFGQPSPRAAADIENVETSQARQETRKETFLERGHWVCAPS